MTATATLPSQPPALEAAPSVSVVIPVFGRDSGLADCLACLERQDFAGAFEIIVVDNGGGAAEDLAAAASSRLRLVEELRPGSYAARNRGVATARGTLLAFTDADCRPASDWLRRGVAALERLERPGMVAGRIQIEVQDPQQPTASELYELVASFRQESYLRRWRFGATANVFVHRAAFEHLGGFDARLFSFGDVDFGVRLHAAGFAQIYAPEVVIHHPARRTIAALQSRGARTTAGFLSLATQAGWPTHRVLAYAPIGFLPLAVLGRGSVLRGWRQRAQVAAVAGRLLAARTVAALRALRRPTSTLRDAPAERPQPCSEGG